MCLAEWVQLSLLGSRERSHGTQPRDTGWNSPAWVPKILTHSNLSFWTTSTASVAGCPGPCPMPQSSQVSSLAPAPDWQLLSLPLEPSSSRSEGMPCYFSLWWQCSCCHSAFQSKHSALSDLGAMVPHQHAGPGSSHSTSHLWMQSLPLHIWFWIRRHQLSHCPWW